MEDKVSVAALEREELDGLRMLQRSNHWLKSYIGGLLCGFGTGYRPTPAQAVLDMAPQIEALESRRRTTVAVRKRSGKRQ